MITKTSPAKVNLYLRVIRKREDGYHDILSLMQRISLCDELTFSPNRDGITVRCPGTPLPEDEGNIVYRAAAAFFSRTGLSPGIDITIRKRIPIGSGLGGGSSNAATTLMTLNEIHGFPMTQQELMKIGTFLGADVPFFIMGKTVWAAGIGDRFTESSFIPDFRFVLINPGFEVSTKSVYQGLNLGLTKRGIHYSIPRFSAQEDVIGGLTNDLERVTVKLYPVLDEIKTLLLTSGARGALMSGSGPTVFGVFTDPESADRAEKNLGQEARWRVFGAQSL
ncbi:MAG: 4-(cytidine 5'-diphospho)-2-C-methyl-D-erythritol kinase [Syntrophales bacterium]|nr:4-(cytidine 5'-diphospho)-2-C-methyl-D-erythritol kinase [Syntrophales bacterium]